MITPTPAARCQLLHTSSAHLCLWVPFDYQPTPSPHGIALCTRPQSAPLTADITTTLPRHRPHQPCLDCPYQLPLSPSLLRPRFPLPSSIPTTTAPLLLPLSPIQPVISPPHIFKTRALQPPTAHRGGNPEPPNPKPNLQNVDPPFPSQDPLKHNR